MSRHIAIVIDPWDFPYNGAVVSTRRFVQALEDRYSFKLLGSPDLNGRVDGRMVQFARISLPGINSILSAMKVPLSRPNRTLLRKTLQGCVLLHVQFPFFLGFAAISQARKLNIPVICSFHVQPENVLFNLGIRSRWISNILYRLFIAAFYNRSDLVIAPSDFAAEILQAHGLIRPVKVISNGVPDRFLSVPDHSDSEISHEVPYKILSVGRLAKEKRQDILLEAIFRSGYRDSIELTIVGAGPQEDKLRKQAASLKLKISFGSVSDEALLALLAAADLFVHTGEIELEGMSVIEAMASGNAVIVSDSKESATARLVSNPRALFRNSDPVDLAAKIDYWLANPRERLMEAKTNRKRARSRTLSDSVAQVASVYDDYLAVKSLTDHGIAQVE